MSKCCEILLMSQYIHNWTKFLSKLVWRDIFQTPHIFLFWGVNFKNLTIEFHVPYVLKSYIKFRLNQMLFTIQSMNLFFIHNFRSQKLEILIFVWWHSNWFLMFLKFCKYEKYNKTIQSNSYIFKIRTQYKFYSFIEIHSFIFFFSFLFFSFLL